MPMASIGKPEAEKDKIPSAEAGRDALDDQVDEILKDKKEKKKDDGKGGIMRRLGRAGRSKLGRVGVAAMMGAGAVGGASNVEASEQAVKTEMTELGEEGGEKQIDQYGSYFQEGEDIDIVSSEQIEPDPEDAEDEEKEMTPEEKEEKMSSFFEDKDGDGNEKGKIKRLNPRTSEVNGRQFIAVDGIELPDGTKINYLDQNIRTNFDLDGDNLVIEVSRRAAPEEIPEELKEKDFSYLIVGEVNEISPDGDVQKSMKYYIMLTDGRKMEIGLDGKLK